MNTYLISYDLNSPGQDYNALHEAIKALGNWWHCLGSVWIVKNSGPSKDVRDALTPHIDDNDSLLVTKLTGEGAWIGFNNECSSWLKENL